MVLQSLERCGTTLSHSEQGSETLSAPTIVVPRGSSEDRSRLGYYEAVFFMAIEYSAIKRYNQKITLRKAV